MSESKNHNCWDGRPSVTGRPLLPPDMTGCESAKQVLVDRRSVDRLLLALHRNHKIPTQEEDL